MIRIFSQAATDDPSILDNKVLDQFTIPVGDWAEQSVRWVDTQMASKIGFDLLGAIKWPFKLLFSTFVRSGDYHPWWEITDMPWWAVCFIFFLAGSLIRNVKIGLFAGTALALCGMLGVEYWDPVSLTLGMILVSVFLCALIGIPLGVMCGRIDGVWNAVRPALDAMQVIHSFVYMLPFIFFFGIGFESSTMVTMIFAIPPLIRLTNLGIRQVPEDVVEASRSYGASEWRVLLDVQLPLARPAIMTGLNQTLLLAISMLGIAALMGAGGLGLMVFRATNNLDVALGASAGLALFTVAVVLDRISQTQATDGMSLLGRINRAINARSNPEVLLAEETAARTADRVGAVAPATVRERQGVIIASVGALITLGAVMLMTWSRGGSLIGSYARRSDMDLAESSTFNGIDAEGGSWFGALCLIGAVVILLSAYSLFRKPGQMGRLLGPVGAFYSSLAIVACSVAYLWMSPSEFASTAFEKGAGPLVTVVGGVIAVTGAVIWLFDSPYSAHTPLSAKSSRSRVVIAAFCLVWTVLSGWAGWTFDERQDTVISPEIQAQLDDVIERSNSGELPGAEAASLIATIRASARQDVVILNNYSAQGPGLGYLLIVVVSLGLLASIPAAGFAGLDERLRWRWNVVSSGIGIAMVSIGGAFTISVLRVSDPNFVSGAGVFLFLVSGAFLALASRSVLNEFNRARLFASDQPNANEQAPSADAPVSEPANA